MPIELIGLDVVQQRLQDMAAVVVPILSIALQQEGDAILEASQPLVPILTRALKNSGRVGDVQLDRAQASVDITYGGPSEGSAGPVNVTYAAKQEFDTTLNHPRGGQSHFLSQPFWAAEQGFTERLADAVRVAL